MSQNEDAMLRAIARSIIGASPLAIGTRYIHPEDGVITITSGYWTDPTNGRLSNFWYWRVESTGETHHGYGGEWPRDFPCAEGCKPSEGDVCGGPRCT